MVSNNTSAGTRGVHRIVEVVVSSKILMSALMDKCSVI